MDAAKAMIPNQQAASPAFKLKFSAVRSQLCCHSSGVRHLLMLCVDPSGAVTTTDLLPVVQYSCSLNSSGNAFDRNSVPFMLLVLPPAALLFVPSVAAVMAADIWAE